MTIPRPTTPILAFSLAGALLQGCASLSAPSGPPARLFAADMNGGARTCDVSPPAVNAANVAEITMKVGSDGGWCGIRVNKGGRPYDTFLLTARAEHGKPFVHTVGNDTRIDYTPEFGFVGTDSFSVRLLPGDTAIRVFVTQVAH